MRAIERMKGEAMNHRELLGSEQLRRKAMHTIHVPLTNGIMMMYIQAPSLLGVSSFIDENGLCLILFLWIRQ